MAVRFESKHSVINNVRRIAIEQVDRAILTIEDDRLEREHTVHQVRKHCKKIRALVRLARPGFEKTFQIENRWYRDSAKPLAVLRDARIRIATFDKLVEPFQKPLEDYALASIRHRLTLEATEIRQNVDVDELLAMVLKRFKKGKKRISGWEFNATDVRPIKSGLIQVYRQVQKSLRIAEDDPNEQNLHQWRKYVKYHWYHCRMLRAVGPKSVQIQRQQVQQLGELLGDANDLAILADQLRTNPSEYGNPCTVELFIELIDQRRKCLSSFAIDSGRRIFAEKPKRFARQFKAYWKASSSRK